jgi:RimJ/RimL family protein N-acetyltransferase
LAFTRSIATQALDVDDLAAFSCCAGDDDPAWIREAENYIRVAALRHAGFVLAFRDDQGVLAAVSAFDLRDIHIPLNAPAPQPGWHLQVLALGTKYQRKGHSKEIFLQTFDEMRNIASERVLVTAYVHTDHAHSIHACAQVGLTYLQPKDEQYKILLGEVPEP